MTDDTDRRSCRGIAADLDRAVDWLKTYLRSRTGADWAFFAGGVLLGHILF
jgi:hypothetical protein